MFGSRHSSTLNIFLSTATGCRAHSTLLTCHLQMCEHFGVIDLLARLGFTVHAKMLTVNDAPVSGPVLVGNGCNMVAALALALILLTTVYILLLSALLAFYISRLPQDPGVNEILKRISGVVPWVFPWRHAAAIPTEEEGLVVSAHSIEQACPVSTHVAPDTRCTICLDSMKAGDPTRILPCNHAFHRPCIDAWIGKGANRCPLCNARILPLASASRNTQGSAEPAAAVAAAVAAASAAAAVANAVATAPEEGNNEQPVRVPWRRRLWMRFRRRR